MFLGVDERAPERTNEGEEKDKVQHSLPDAGLQPRGEPYFVIDTAHHKELADKAVQLHGGQGECLFIDLRAEILCLDFESTGVVAEARALVDWNKRSESGWEWDRSRA